MTVEHHLRLGPKVGDGGRLIHGGHGVNYWTKDAVKIRRDVQKDIFRTAGFSFQHLEYVRDKWSSSILPDEM